MEFNPIITAIANRMRVRIQKETETVDEGESAAILAWYGFICDHARYCNLDPKQLARDQLEAFLEHVPVAMVRA